MQPAPLTGTVTCQHLCAAHNTQDAARTPHGDSNVAGIIILGVVVDAARTPHGDSNPAETLGSSST